MKNKIAILILLSIIYFNLHAQTWVKVACGGEFSVALRSDSTLWAWGNNASGQLGTGNTLTQTQPVQIGTSHLWKDVVAGGFHCIALKTDGTLWAWGLNGNGQLGDSTTTGKTSPVQIGNSNDWSKIYVGQAHSMAIKNNGTLWAWGFNYYGGLGDSSTSDKIYPKKISNDTDWKQIACGGLHTIALKTNGALWGWGYDGEGELGDSATTNISYPKHIGNDTNWAMISTGFQYSLGLKTNGSIWSWGFNGNGQLGIGNNKKELKTTSQISPTQIGSDINWKNITAGSAYAFAIKNDSSLWAWGFNGNGQLGIGSTIEQDAPVEVMTVDKWKSIAAATGVMSGSSVYGAHSLGLKYQYTGICASGANYIGQLGNGTTTALNQFDCSIATSIVANVMIDKPIWVYPNPTQEIINFSLESDNCEVIIFNSLGQNVKQLKLTKGINTFVINNLKQGIYFYNIIESNYKTIHSGKFIKE